MASAGSSHAKIYPTATSSHHPSSSSVHHSAPRTSTHDIDTLSTMRSLASIRSANVSSRNRMSHKLFTVPGRRLYRLVVLWTILLHLALIAPMILRYFHGKLRVATFAASTPLLIRATNCDIRIGTHKKRGFSLRVRALMHRLSSWSVERGATTNSFRVDHPFPSRACTIVIKLPRMATTISALRIESWRRTFPSDSCVTALEGCITTDCLSACDSSLIVDQQPYRSVLWSTTTQASIGDLTIYGSMIDVDIAKLEANTISIVALKGAISARRLRVNGTTSLTNFQGDILATFLNTPRLLVNYTTRDSDFCLAAANVTLSNANASTGTTTLCGPHVLCSHDTQPGGLVPTLIAFAPKGAVYSTLLTNAELAILQGHSMSTPHLDDESQYYLKETRNWINEKATEDHMQVVQLVGPRQSSIGRFVHTTNPAYLYVRPWVLATMSATVLKPRVRIVYASPVGHCPYAANDLLIDEDESVLDYVLGSWDNAIRVSAQISEPEKTFLNARSTNDATSTYYERDISATAGYAAFDTSIFSYTFGFVSIAVSLALASLAAACAVCSLGRAVRHFINFVNERGRQLDVFHKAWAKYEAGTLLHPTVDETHQYHNRQHYEASVSDEHASEADACGSDLFEIVENAVDRILAIRRNSLEAFIDVVCRERGPHEPVGDDVTLDEFREAYELWSIQHAMRCCAVDDESAARIFLERAKHTIVRSSDASTDAYVCVRFRSTAEVQRGRLLGETPRMLPGETSLGAFLRLRCVITGLDRDFVLRHDLARKYWNFIDAMHIASPQPMTKGNLRATGIEMRRLTIARLHSQQGGSNLVLDLGLAEAKGHWHPKHRHQKRHGVAFKPSHWRALIMQDILVVMSHVVVVGSPPIIFALLAAYSQGQEQPVSNKAWCHYSQSWLGPRYSCFSRYSPWNAAISTVTLAIWVAFAFHATLYYIIVEPNCMSTSTHAHPLGPLTAVTNAITYRAWLLSLGSMAGYGALSLVWWMLAVVINPDEYLAYGVSVVVLLGVVFTRTSAVATLTDNLTSRMTAQVKQALQFWACENAAKIPQQSRVADANSTANQSREMVLRTISTQAASLVGDVKPDLVFHLFDDDDNRVKHQEAVEVFAKTTNLSPHLVRYVLAKCKHDADAVQDIAVGLAAESAVALPAQLVLSLCDIIRHPRSASSIKRLANAWASEVLGLPGTVDADLVAHTILCKFEPVAFVRAFGFDNIPAFKLLIAKQNNDIDFMYDAAMEIIDTCLLCESPQPPVNVEKHDVWETPRSDADDLLLTGHAAVSEGSGSTKSQLARLSSALHAWRHLKEGKRILLQDENETALYEDLGELLFSMDGVEVVPRPFAGMLVRLVLSRVAGRKSLMLREAPKLAEFVNKFVLPATSDTFDYTIDVESMEALLACKYGSDVNVRSFARECSISESLANSIAFILASSNTSSGGTAMFTLLTSLDLGANTTFLAESTSKTANPTRVLGLIALVQRTPHLPELSHFTFGLVKEFAILHLGGEEPKVAKLASKVHVITNLIFLLCSRNEKAMRDAAKRIHRLDRTRAVPDALVDLLLFAYDDNFDFGGTHENLVAALAAVDGARDADSLALNETAAAVVVAITEDSGVPLVDDILALLRQHTSAKRTGGVDSLHVESSLWVSLVTSLLNARNELPMNFVRHVVKSCFKGRSLVTQKPALAALEQLLQMSYVADKNEAAIVSLSRDVATLLDMDPESLESVLHVITQHSNDESDHDCDSNRPASECESGDYQEQSNSLITDWLKSGRGNANEEESMKNAALFARKWTKAQTLSRRSIAGLSTMSERSSVPNFYLATLALGADPTQSSKAMDDLRDFMASNLGWEHRWILCLQDFAMRNECCFDVIDNELGFACVRIACLLFGNAAEANALKFSRAPAILLPNPKTLNSEARRRLEQRRACFAALLAFGSHSVSPLPDVIVGDDGKYRLVSAVDAVTVASVLPRDVLAYELDLPAPLLGALNELSSCTDDDGLRQSLLSLLGHQTSARGIPFPGVVGLAEDHARAILSLTLGHVDGLEEAAMHCDVEPRLVEGLAIVCASRASDSTKHCNMPKLLNNAGLMTLCHWSGIDVKQGAAIVALVKLDTAHATAISEALSLPAPIAPCYIEAMATCSQVANFASSAKMYAMGFARLTNCLGPIATIYAIKDRRAAETSALIVRLCQGDAGPLRALHNRLGIGKRDLPLLGSLVVLCSPAPVNAEYGSVDDWMSSRHAASAARNLAKVLRLDEHIVMTLVLAGRGLRAGLRNLSSFLQPIVGNLPGAPVKTNSILALVICAVHASADARNGLSTCKALLELCDEDDSTVRHYISNTIFEDPVLPDASHLLHGLALATGLPARVVHFLLAMTTTEAARSIDAVVEHHLKNTVDHGTLSKAELADAVRVLVSLAVGDELELRRAGYDSQLLRRLSFKVHSNTSTLVVDGELSEHHPIVFLLRFAKRDASCFDVKASLRQNTAPIAESIYPQLGVLKAIFGLMAHDYRSLVQGTRLTTLAEAMQVPLEPIRAIAGIAMRGSAVTENRWVSSLAAERARIKCCSYHSKRPVVSYGCEPSELRRHMKTLASYTGAKNSVYLNSFMAGCSEDRRFLSDALTPLAIKLKIHVELAVDLVRAAQRDRDALAALASHVLGTPAIHHQAKMYFEDMANDTLHSSRSSADLGSSTLRSSKTVHKQLAPQRWLSSVITKMAHFVLDALTDEYTQALLALLVIVDLTVHFLYLTSIIERTIASNFADMCITLVFVVELSARFGAFAILNPAAPLDFFRNKQVHMLELGVTILDLAIVLAEAVVFGRSARSYRFVKGLRLLKLFRIARVAAKVSSGTESDEMPRDTQAVQRYLSFLALLKLKDESVALDEWSGLRAVLGHGLFGQREDDDGATSLAPCDPPEVARAAVLVARSDLRHCRSVIRQVTQENDDVLELAEFWVDLWNRDVLAFVDCPEKASVVDTLDTEFWLRTVRKGGGPRGGFSVFLGCVCGMTTFVSEWLAFIAQEDNNQSEVNIRYPPVAPRLLLALKRDNVLICNDSNNTVQVKPKYERPIENLLMSLVGLDHKCNRLQYQSDVERKTKLALFAALLSMLPRGALPNALQSAVGLGRSVLDDLERLLAPFADIDASAIERLSVRIVRNLRPAETMALREVHNQIYFSASKERSREDLSSTIAVMLQLLSCGSVQDLDIAQAKPLFTSSQRMKVDGAFRLLELIDDDQRASKDRRHRSLSRRSNSATNRGNIAYTADCDALLDSDEFSQFASSLIVKRVSPNSAREAWQKKSAEFASLVFGTSLAIEGANTRDPVAVARGAKVIAEALDFPDKQVNGFFALAALDTAGFLDLVGSIGEATSQEASNLTKFFTFCQPLVAAIRSGRPDPRGKEPTNSSEPIRRKHLPYDELCAKVDVERSLGLNFDEYKYALHILGLDQSTARMLDDFVRDDEKGAGRVTYENFERGMERRHKQLAIKLLTTHGLDSAAQTRSVILAVFILLLIFAFIFVGVAAFAKSNTLATVVNGALPAIAGLANVNTASANYLFSQLERLVATVADVVQLESVSKLAGHSGALVLSAAKARIHNALTGRS